MTQAIAVVSICGAVGRFFRRGLRVCPAQRAWAATEAISARRSGVSLADLNRAISAAASLAIGRMVANIHMLAQETACNRAMLALGFNFGSD